MGNFLNITCGECIKDNYGKRDSYFINETDKSAPKNVIDIKVNTGNFIIQRTKSLFECYEKIQPLGQGEFGCVYKVRRKNTGTIEIIRALK